MLEVFVEDWYDIFLVGVNEACVTVLLFVNESVFNQMGNCLLNRTNGLDSRKVVRSLGRFRDHGSDLVLGTPQTPSIRAFWRKAAVVLAHLPD
jgi:aryl carrier-like protein